MPFIVIADNDNENHLNARRATSAALSIPVFGETHPHDPAMFCIGADAKRRPGSLNVFDVTARYTSDRGTTEDEQTQPNPLLWGSKKRLVFQDVVEPYAYDALNLPSLASNGLMFDPLPVRDVSRTILEIEKNVLATSVGELAYYTNKVNSDAFYGWEPGEVRLKIVGGTEQSHTDTDTGITIRYVNVTYQLMFKEHQQVRSVHNPATVRFVVAGWDDAILNQGTIERAAIGGGAFNLFKIRQDSDPATNYGTTPPSGELLNDPQLLDSAGRLLLAPGELLEDSILEPTYQIRRPYARIAFGPLNLL